MVKVSGQARAHHAYQFAIRRTDRMKSLAHDRLGLWLRARRLHPGSEPLAHPPARPRILTILTRRQWGRQRAARMDPAARFGWLRGAAVRGRLVWRSLSGRAARALVAACDL
ncbi:MAG: IS66 family insertion sequence element accessory protein TnpB [Burkholderiaceae bacterium]